MIDTSGWANDNFGGSCSEWDSRSKKCFDNLDFNTYNYNVENGIADTSLDGKLTPHGYIIDPVTGGCKLSGYVKYTSHSDFCRERCGDGKNLGHLMCDDSNTSQNDGCSHKWTVEAGAVWTGGSPTSPDSWYPCGDGFREGPVETCDDGNNSDGDGWSSGCKVETHWTWTGGSCKCLLLSDYLI